jgi:hypothetical protein
MNATQTKSRTETIGDFQISYEPEGDGDPAPWVIRETGDDGCYDSAATRRQAQKVVHEAMAERMQDQIIERIGRVKNLEKLQAILDLIK